MADIELNEDPTSTWGATPAYKEAWNAKHGDSAPAGNASKAEWVDYAVKHGASAEDAEAATVADLKAAYGEAGVTGVVPITALSDAQSASEGTTYGNPPAGSGTDSGTAEGTASTSSSPTTGTKGR